MVNKVTSNPLRQLELQIRDDKLKQGIDGLEWLVLFTNVTEFRQKSLDRWLEFASEQGYDVESIMKDAIKMWPDSFYSKHELNWWIAIDEALTYLSLMRQQDYDRYFDFIQSVYEGDKPC